MRKLLLSAMFFVSVLGFAQVQTTESVPNKWTYGGYAGFGGGSGGTSIYISPRVGYKVNPDLVLGLAGNLSWRNYNGYSSSMYGVGPYANYYMGRSFFLTGMFQQYFMTIKDHNYKLNTQESALYLGAGYMQRLGNGVYFQVGAMYNVLYNPDKSHFSNGFIPYTGIVVGI